MTRTACESMYVCFGYTGVSERINGNLAKVRLSLHPSSVSQRRHAVNQGRCRYLPVFPVTCSVLIEPP